MPNELQIYLIIFLAIVTLIVLLRPYIKADVWSWLDKDHLYIRQYFKLEKVPFGQIKKVEMVTVDDGEEHIQTNYFPISLKLTLASGREIRLNRNSQPSGLKLGSLSKDLFKNYNFDLLPAAEILKKIKDENPETEFDQYSLQYLETGNCEAYIKLLNG